MSVELANTQKKEVCALSPQLELSPISPSINGFRQSTLTFKKNIVSAKKTGRGNENVESPRSDLPVTEAIIKPESKTRGKKTKKQALLTDTSFTSLESTPPSVVKTKTRGRKAKGDLVVTAKTVPKPAQEEKQPKQAGSVSPKKQPRADSTQRKQPVRMQQTKLSGFGVRRTARQYAKDLLKQQEADVISTIVNSEEAGMKIVVTEEKGRGVITTRTFAAGDFVVEYIGDLIPDNVARAREVEYKKNPDLGSYMFFFAHSGQRYCVDATKESDKLGRLINHSRLNPNCLVKVIPIDGIPRLALFAKREISPGEELLYDYGDRGKESLIAHPWLKS